MNEIIRTAAISPLRQRMIDDMNVRRFSRETQRNYVRDVGRFAALPAALTRILLRRMTCAGSRSNSVTPACRRRYP